LHLLSKEVECGLQGRASIHPAPPMDMSHSRKFKAGFDVSRTIICEAGIF
jgi:hypothetical protein